VQLSKVWVGLDPMRKCEVDTLLRRRMLGCYEILADFNFKQWT
jgi:hypothetical protein